MEFICVAFQNRVAYAMGGVTIHSSGEIPVGGQYANRRLEHLDVDVLFTKNQHLRWILIDEALMIPDELLGQYAANFESAARDTRYRRRADSSPRIFGGYNVLLFGDMNQLPPIPSSTALFIPPISKKSEAARQMLNMFWEDGPDSLNFYVELTKQERIQDEWYRKFLHECRQGQLTDEMYYFIIGVATEHPGSWTPGPKGERPFLACGNDACAELPTTWREMALNRATWEDMQAMECDFCKKERSRRNRLLEQSDERVKHEPFLSAPYVHRNNEPKYHAMLLRAVEMAKRNPGGPLHILWIRAHDTPHNPQEIASTAEKVQKKKERFLQFHDQKTAGIPGLLPLYYGMKCRVTEKLARKKGLTILKHQPGYVIGWDLHTGDRVFEEGAERLLNYLPLIIYVKFPEATWRVHRDLDCGVFPMQPVKRTWILNSATETKVTRHGYALVPDFASTAFMIQGSTLNAELADCGDILATPTITDMVTTYVILSRVRKADSLLLLRAFSLDLFRLGMSPGPYCLLKLLCSRLGTSKKEGPTTYSTEDALGEYKTLAERWEGEKNLKKARGIDWKCVECVWRFRPSALMQSPLQ